MMTRRADEVSISVVIPVYNSELTLLACLQSVQKQIHRNFQCIIIDDHSIDKSVYVANEIVNCDGRFKLFRNDVNLGPSNCRNIGLKEATGTYVFFIDSDDTIPEHALSNLLKFSLSNKLSYCISAHHQFDTVKKIGFKKNNSLSNSCVLSNSAIFDYVNKYTQQPYRSILFVHCWGRLYDLDLIKRKKILFDSRLTQMEDVAFNFLYLNFCNRVGYLDEELYVHNVGAMTLGSKKGSEFNYCEMLSIAVESVRLYLERKNEPKKSLEKKIEHLYVSMSIIAVIRLSKMSSIFNVNFAANNIRYIFNSEIGRKSILKYEPIDLDSRLLALAYRFCMPIFAIIVCKLKLRFKLRL